MSIDLTGKFLVASPHLSDGNFLRSVVFILRHDPQGAFGLALDRPTDRKFGDLIQMSSQKGPSRDDDFIYVGGPVQGPLLALHDLAGVGDPVGQVGDDPSGQCVVHDNPAEPWGSMSIELGNPPAWITGDEDHLRILYRRLDVRVRFVADYSGWGPQQLDLEFQAGGWLYCDATSDLVFGPPDQLWRQCVCRCGNEVFGDTVPGMQSVSPTVN
ncbi:YqgE/AlgH family protein [Crateriforma conspicua]|uniref:Uncharacterized protein n=1 Tax=Crateriforma conspicua TaxID=2527996 RepID=A0A5C5Y3B8_9PLAN|nr:YqgE/AlgH family protein [Crateriforma conspicua]QDV64242.1 hypothetical protein Mal65_33930 [Crateriforma conspicua]TWT69634.1 hypothetical protein Pan14r_19230 [Crateriforma conspicua]